MANTAPSTVRSLRAWLVVAIAVAITLVVLVGGAMVMNQFARPI